MPPPLAPLWEIYLELAVGRGAGGMGMGAIGWQDVAAWCRTTGHELSGWEAATLIQADRAVRAAIDKD